MTGYIGADEVRRVKEANDLVQVMADYAPPRKAGRDFVVCCPFHQERTPSCHLYVEQQTYHCFGCGAHGDVISLVQEQENLAFVDAVELLARRAGIQITYERVGRASMRRGERERLLAAMELATAYYEDRLWRSREGEAARDYLSGRGFDEQLCRRFRLGWAPGHGQLLEEARQNRFEPELLKRLDLVRDYDERLSDRFFDRLMFPIRDRLGAPIAFSGRLLPEKQRELEASGRRAGKYINSTDTPLYNKSRVVYNLHRARGFCRDAERLVVMEGPTDVMAADRAGYGECAAVLGTSLTADHARQLGGVIGNEGNLVLLLDGDAAGREKTVKAIHTCLAAGVPVRVAILPEGADPAELLAEANGRERFEVLLADQAADIDHLLRSLAPHPHRLDHRRRLALIDEVLATLRQIRDRDLRDGYLRDLAEYFHFDHHRLEQRLTRGGASVRETVETAETAAAEAELDVIRDLVLQLLVTRPALRAPAFDEWGCEPCFFPEPWQDLVCLIGQEPEAGPDELLLSEDVQGEPALRDAIFRWQRDPDTGRGGIDSGSDPERLLADSVRRLRKDYLQTRVDDLREQLGRAQRDDDLSAQEAVFAELAPLQAEMKRLARQEDGSAAAGQAP